MATRANQVAAQIMHRPLYFGSQSTCLSSTLAASFLVAATALGLLLTSNRFAHWFLFPIGICGVLIGADGIEWLRGRLDLYDPIGIIGLFGFHFFFLAPLFHVGWDLWMGGVAPPPDWRDWFGYMGILNATGLFFYRICRQIFAVKLGPRLLPWYLDKAKSRLVLPVCVVISVAAQAWFYAKVGGMVGYMEARMDRSPQSGFEGMGWFFTISESAPILVAFLVIVYAQGRKISWSGITGALLILFALQIYFGGLRGSRSETSQLVFWVVGCIHFLIRPVPRRLIYAVSVFLIVFMYFYGFYKDLGKDAFNALSSSEERAQIEQKTGRTAEALALGDLGRADVQAFVLYKLTRDGRDFIYAKGRTYIGALSLWLPRWILRDRPETKLKEGTDIQAGGGAYAPDAASSRVYGLAGESMLNFGAPSVPFAYALFGLLVGWFRNGVSRLAPGDARFLLVPYGVYCCLSTLGSDSDNLAFGLAKNLSIPLLVVAACSARGKCFGASSENCECDDFLPLLEKPAPGQTFVQK